LSVAGEITGITGVAKAGYGIANGNYKDAALGAGQVVLGKAKAVSKLGGWLKSVLSSRIVSKTSRNKTEIVERWMSKAELEATQETGLLRGGRGGIHYVTDSANSTAQRARQRLALPQTPEVRAILEVPKGVFSKPSRVGPLNNMLGGGLERTAVGNISVSIIGIRK